MERKTLGVQLKGGLDERGQGTAVISTMGAVDADGDIVELGAFGRQRVVFLRGHDWQSFPLGHAEVSEQGDKAIANLELNLSSSAGRAAYDWLKWDHERGGLQEFSYGFTIVQPGGAEVQRIEDGRTIRRLKKLRLHEVSMVVRGAGVGTRLVAIKGELPEALAARTAQIATAYWRLCERIVRAR